MPLVTEPLTSLLQRELTILAKQFGSLSGTCWEISRLLLRAREEYGMMAINKGKSGAESDVAASQADPFQADLFEGVDVKSRSIDPADPKNTAPGRPNNG